MEMDVWRDVAEKPCVFEIPEAELRLEIKIRAKNERTPGRPTGRRAGRRRWNSRKMCYIVKNALYDAKSPLYGFRENMRYMARNRICEKMVLYDVKSPLYGFREKCTI